MKNSEDEIGVYFEESSGQENPNDFDKGYHEGLHKGYEQGYADGLTVGHRLGTESVAAKLRTSLGVLEASAETFLQQQALLFQMARPEFLRMSLAVAKQVLRQELVKPENLAAQIDHYLDDSLQSFANEAIEIHLSDHDFEQLKPFLENWQLSGSVNLIVLPDSTLQPGDFIIRNRFAFIHHQLDRIMDELYIRASEEG